MSAFSRNHLFYSTSIPQSKFCLECGLRPLPGDYRYQEGDIWEERGVNMVRCRACKEIGRLHAASGSKICADCVMELTLDGQRSFRV